MAFVDREVGAEIASTYTAIQGKGPTYCESNLRIQTLVPVFPQMYIYAKLVFVEHSKQQKNVHDCLPDCLQKATEAWTHSTFNLLLSRLLVYAGLP